MWFAASCLAAHGPATAQGFELADLQPPPWRVEQTALPMRLLLETPWPSAVGLLLAGVVVAFVLNRAARARAGILALALGLLLAAANVLLARAVTTTPEALSNRTRELISAVADGDRARAGEILDPTVMVDAGGYFQGDYERTLSYIDRPTHGVVDDTRILGMRSQADDQRVGRTQFGVRVQTPGGPAPIWAVITWIQRDDDWHVRQIDVIRVIGDDL